MTLGPIMLIILNKGIYMFAQMRVLLGIRLIKIEKQNPLKLKQ